MLPNPEQIEQLKKYRNEAQLKPEWEDKYLSSTEATLLLIRLLPSTTSLTFPEQLHRDLTNTSMFRALADWCDHEKGLAHYYPSYIIDIAQKLLG